MKNLLCILLLSAAVGSASGCGAGSARGDHPQDDGPKGEVQPQVTGGACRYSSYEGTVTVKEVHSPSEAGGDPTVTIEFEAVSPSAAPAALRRFTQEVRAPREKADALGLAIGKKYTAPASYITSGTCAPGPYLAGPEEWH